MIFTISPLTPEITKINGYVVNHSEFDKYYHIVRRKRNMVYKEKY